MSIMEATLVPSTQISALGIMHLERYWQKAMMRAAGTLSRTALADEWNTDITLLATLGLGLEQTVRYLYSEMPGFNAFEQWILEHNNGHIPAEKIIQFNTLVEGGNAFQPKEDIPVNVLNAEDLDCWEQNGYVIVRNAVPEADCHETIAMICNFLQIDVHDPATWYHSHPAKQGIMVQLFQHPLLERNRQSARIRGAFEQLWQRNDIWVNTDRVGFNPPETNNWQFPGPRLHWDVSLQLPVPFGTQGILYLADTLPNQGAFTLVPGFRHRIESWLHALPGGADPRREDLYALGAVPITANAGDFIIWDQALPHGSSPNTSPAPRFVQYINYMPVDAEIRKEWK